MDRYVPPFSITDQMLLLVGRISEKIGRIDGSNALGARPRLRRNNQLRSIHSTLLTEDEQFVLLATEGMLVKRLFLISDNTVCSGFKEAEYERLSMAGM